MGEVETDSVRKTEGTVNEAREYIQEHDKPLYALIKALQERGARVKYIEYGDKHVGRLAEAAPPPPRLAPRLADWVPGSPVTKALSGKELEEATMEHYRRHAPEWHAKNARGAVQRTAKRSGRK